MVEHLERMNPWWRAASGKKTPDVRRWAYDEVLKRLGTKITPVIAMRGPRQVGKTTIQLQVIERLLTLRQIHPSRILRVQFDDVPSLGSLGSPIESLVKWFEKHVLGKSLNQAARDGDPAYLFFDEVQNLAAWSEQIKALVDHSDVQILVTGSSALRIGEGRDSLAGRLSSMELGPLRLSEISRMRGFPTLAPFSSIEDVNDWLDKDFWKDLNSFAKRRSNELDVSFEAFSKYGGYPICHSTADLDVTSLSAQIIEDVVERTICHERAHGVSEGVVRETFHVLCRHAGERVSDQKLAEQVSVRTSSKVSQTQIKSAVSYLENTLLIRLLKPLEANRAKRNDCPTICLCDHFLRFALLREEIPLSPNTLASCDEAVCTQAGHLIEGIIGNYFAGAHGVNAFWLPERPKKPEVDVVLSIGMRRIPIEVKYRKKVVKHDQLEGIRTFCKTPHLGADFGLVVTREASGEIEKGIIAIPAKAVLLLL